MKLIIKFLPLSLFLFSAFALSNIDARAQYNPFGPQINVPVETVTNGGWTQCYIDTYDNFLNAQLVLSQCPGARLMLACRETGSQTLMLLAWGNRQDVIFNTGINTNVTHIANGVGWYFNLGPIGDAEEGQNAWGFVTAGEQVNKNNCDFQTEGNDRLCWHLQQDVGGYRCGNVGDSFGNLNFPPGGEEYERIVYQADALPTNVPTLSEWGLIAMATILGIVGFLVMRRRKVTA